MSFKLKSILALNHFKMTHKCDLFLDENCISHIEGEVKMLKMAIDVISISWFNPESARPEYIWFFGLSITTLCTTFKKCQR